MGRRVHTLGADPFPVTTAVFSPDGQRIVSGSRDKSLNVWDAESGKALLTLTGHTGDVTGVAFSPDGTGGIVSGGQDKTVRVWDAEKGGSSCRSAGTPWRRTHPRS